MIKFLTKEKIGKPVILGFGLSRLNCEKLLEGKPIKIRMQDMIGRNNSTCLKDVDILIFAGETEKAMQEELALYGKIPKDIRTHQEEN